MQSVLITVQSAGEAVEGVLGLVEGVDDGVFNLVEDVADAFEEAFLGGSGDCRHQQGKDENHLHLVPVIYTGSEKKVKAEGFDVPTILLEGTFSWSLLMLQQDICVCQNAY